MTENTAAAGKAGDNRLLERLLGGIEEHLPFHTFLDALVEELDATVAALLIHGNLPGERDLLVSANAPDVTAPEDDVQTFIQHPSLVAAGTGPRSLPDRQVRELASRLKSLPLQGLLVVNFDGGELLSARLAVATRAPADRHCAAFALLSKLYPELGAALRLYGRFRFLTAKGRLYDELISRVGVGEIHVNSEGAVTYTNLLAESLLAEGHLLTLHQRRLICPDASDNQRLQEQIRLARKGKLKPGEDTLYLHAADPYDIIGLVIRALPQVETADAVDGDAENRFVAIYIGDHTRRLPFAADLMRKLFNLTAAEARVAVLLATGKSTEDTARTLAVSRNTVRTHLQQIYAKTGVSRQNELTHMVVRTLAAVWLDPRQLANP